MTRVGRERLDICPGLSLRQRSREWLLLLALTHIHARFIASRYHMHCTDVMLLDARQLPVLHAAAAEAVTCS